MADILKLFSTKNVISYVQARNYQTYLGDALFPARKVPSLETEILEDTHTTPVIAPMSAFDAEAQIGSREANVRMAELGYMKRKIQLKEKDLVALRNPRTPEEQTYLTQLVYNDTDKMVQGVLACIELMRMQLLANGIIVPDDDNIGWQVDYGLPKEHQVSADWSDPKADIIGNINDWVATMDSAPTRAITSKKILNLMLKNEAILDYFKRLNLIPSANGLNQVMDQVGLPTIVTYDLKYRAENKETGNLTSNRYFPEDKFVMFDEDTTGETLFGPTPEESRLLSNSNMNVTVGNVFATMYEEGNDPVGTWTKAAATALPTLANTEQLFQAKITLPTVSK